MKKTDIRQTISVLANVGVLVGILLLVYELAQNRQLMRAQTRHEISQGVIDQFFRLGESAEFSEFSRRGYLGQLESVEEKARYDNLLLARFRYWEDVHFQYRMGLFDDAEFDAAKRGWGRMLIFETSQIYWRTYRADYSPEFVAEIDGIIAEVTSAR